MTAVKEAEEDVQRAKHQHITPIDRSARSLTRFANFIGPTDRLWKHEDRRRENRRDDTGHVHAKR